MVVPGASGVVDPFVGGRLDAAGSDPNGVPRMLNQGYVKIGDLTGFQAVDTDSNGAAVATRVVPAAGGSNATPRIGETTAQPVGSVGPATMPIDFPALFTTYRARGSHDHRLGKLAVRSPPRAGRPHRKFPLLVVAPLVRDMAVLCG